MNLSYLRETGTAQCTQEQYTSDLEKLTTFLNIKILS